MRPKKKNCPNLGCITRAVAVEVLQAVVVRVFHPVVVALALHRVAAEVPQVQQVAHLLTGEAGEVP